MTAERQKTEVLYIGVVLGLPKMEVEERQGVNKMRNSARISWREDLSHAEPQRRREEKTLEPRKRRKDTEIESTGAVIG